MKKAYGTTTDTAVGGILHPEGHDPTLVIDPEYVGYGFWRGRKKPKKGAVSATELEPGKIKTPRPFAGKEFPTLLASAESEPVAIVLPAELFRGFQYDVTKPVDQLNHTEMGQEIKTLSWSLSTMEQKNTPDFEAMRKMRNRLAEIKDHIDFKRQLQLSLKNKVLNDVGKAFGKKPEMAAPGRQPAQNSKQGVNAGTGKKKYAYPEAKTGSSASAPKQKAEAKPDRHTAASVSARLGVPLEDLKGLAGKMSERKFVSHLRTHKLKDLVAHQIHGADLTNIHLELTRQA